MASNNSSYSNRPISRRKFLGLATATMGGAVALTTGTLYFGNQADEVTIERIQIPVKNLPPALEGFTIAQLSDFHLYPFTELEYLRQVVTATNNLKPDLITLGGDYVTRDAGAIFELAPVLGALNAKYGVFAILGNHDYWTDLPTITHGLTGAGLPVLVNDGFLLDVGRAQLYLAGLDDAWSSRPDLSAAMANWANAAPVLLLAHEPDPVDRYSQDNRVSLQLSGHSHGGQIRLPGKGALILPWLGEKYDMGLYRVNETWLYTNRGLGTVAEPMRVNCPPEIAHFTLVSA